MRFSCINSLIGRLILNRIRPVAEPEAASLQLDGVHERNESNRPRTCSGQGGGARRNASAPPLDFSWIELGAASHSERAASRRSPVRPSLATTLPLGIDGHPPRIRPLVAAAEESPVSRQGSGQRYSVYFPVIPVSCVIAYDLSGPTGEHLPEVDDGRAVAPGAHGGLDAGDRLQGKTAGGQ